MGSALTFRYISEAQFYAIVVCAALGQSISPNYWYALSLLAWKKKWNNRFLIILVLGSTLFGVVCSVLLDYFLYRLGFAHLLGPLNLALLLSLLLLARQAFYWKPALLISASPQSPWLRRYGLAFLTPAEALLPILAFLRQEQSYFFEKHFYDFGLVSLVLFVLSTWIFWGGLAWLKKQSYKTPGLWQKDFVLVKQGWAYFPLFISVMAWVLLTLS